MERKEAPLMFYRSQVGIKIFAVAPGSGNALASRARSVSPNDDNVLLALALMAVAAVILIFVLRAVVGRGKLPWKF
jgi:hypothetical protein